MTQMDYFLQILTATILELVTPKGRLLMRTMILISDVPIHRTGAMGFRGTLQLVTIVS